ELAQQVFSLRTYLKTPTGEPVVVFSGESNELLSGAVVRELQKLTSTVFTMPDDRLWRPITRQDHELMQLANTHDTYLGVRFLSSGAAVFRLTRSSRGTRKHQESAM